MKHTAIYPGTFDPITNGHIDLIGRAAKLFDKVVVAVAPTSRKAPLLSLDQRVSLITEVLALFHNVRVAGLYGLLVDFANQHGASIIVRGLRAASDFDYKCQLAYMNYRMAPKIQTIFLPGSEGTSFISGTMVREIIDLGGDPSLFVPPIVAQYLKSFKKR